MPTYDILLSQLKLARAQKTARSAELACILKIADDGVPVPVDYATEEARTLMRNRAAGARKRQKPPALPQQNKISGEKVAAPLAQLAGKLLNKGTAMARGAVGMQAPQQVRGTQQLMNRANQANTQANNAAHNAIGSRVVAGSPEHQALLNSGAKFKSHGLVPVQGGKALPNNSKNMRAALKNAPAEQQAQGNAMLHRQLATRARIPQPPGLPQAQSQGLRDADGKARWLTQRAIKARDANKHLYQSYRAGQAAQPYVAGAAGLAGVGGAGYGLHKLMNAGLPPQGQGSPAMAQPDIFQQPGVHTAGATLREKIASRIINADVGLDAIIAHIKAAKVKRASC